MKCRYCSHVDTDNTQLEEHIRIHHAVIRNDDQATRTNVHRLIHDVVECWQNHVARNPNSDA
jgi:DNA-binding FadR family transcriptional regulator